MENIFRISVLQIFADSSRFIIIILILVIFYRCTDRDALRIYENREKLLALCDQYELKPIRGKKSGCFLNTCKDSNDINMYTVAVDSAGYRLVWDSIEYQPDILGFQGDPKSEEYKNQVEEYVQDLETKLNSLGVIGFNINLRDLAPEKFAFHPPGGGIVVLYVPDLRDFEMIKLGKGHRNIHILGDRWYYTY